MTELRPYQQDAVNSVVNVVESGGGNPVVELPTGTGKGLTIAALAGHAVSKWNARVGIITDRARLVQQNANELSELLPGVRSGIYSAGLGRRDVGRQVMFLQVQSAYNKPELMGLDVVIVDECHIQGGRYRQFHDGVMSRNPDARFIGLSATPFVGPRATPITEVESAIYTSIPYRMGIRTALDDGWLCPLVVQETDAQIDTDGVKINAGEFAADEMAARADTPEINADVIEKTRYALARKRRAGMWFVASVKHAHKLREFMLAHGVSCEVIDGSTSATRCDQIYAACKSGIIKVLLTVNKALTGVNLPWLDFGGMVRATNIPGVQIQAAGRLMRTFKEGGKEDALWWCYGTNVKRLGPIDDIKRKPKRDPNHKTCGACCAVNLTFARVCKECGMAFPESEATDDKPDIVSAAPSMLPIIRNVDGSRDTTWTITDRMVTLHRAHKDATPVLRVDHWGYRDGKQDATSQCILSEFLAFESWRDSEPHRKAVAWWRENAGGSVPSRCVDAFDRKKEIRVMTKLVTRKNPGDKYPVPVSRVFRDAVQVGLF
jgi:DNA repair protein RadD